MSIYEHRLSKVRQAMAERDIDLMFLSPLASWQYLTGVVRQQNYSEMIFPGDWIRGAFISQDKGPILCVPRLQSEVLIRQTQGKPWIQDVRVCGEQDDADALLKGIIADLGVRGNTVAMGDRAWASSVSAIRRALPGATVTMASEIIMPLRVIKDEEEIAMLRKAGQISEAVFQEIVDGLRPGVTEHDVSYEIERLSARYGCDGGCTAVGVRFMRPGHRRSIFVKTTDEKLQYGDTISFDFGLWYEGFCSDVGTTVSFGEPTDEFRKIHTIVMRAQHAAIDAMKDGKITGEEMDRIARGVITEEGYREKFVHRLGHAIGLDVHEAPFLDEGEKTVLRSGMCFCLEPSINLGHVGCRAEDMVVVRENGGEPLTGFSRRMYVAG